MKKILCYIYLVLLLGCSNSKKISSFQSEKIVIINIGLYSRIGISSQIDFIRSLDPKVIAIDISFDKEVNDYHDSLLVSSLTGFKNIVMAIILDNDNLELTGASGILGTLPKFHVSGIIGYTNVLLDGSSPPLLKRFTLYDSINNNRFYHFAVQTAMLYDSAKTTKFLTKNKRIVDIRYTGNLNSFKSFSANDALNKTIPRNEIENKIVLLGYIGPVEDFPIHRYDEDKFYTPLNSDPLNTAPDMHGVIYLANLISQILSE